jgi:flavin reductase (DIM6/NTAB) family NADH-FMN oxidoreductase RutF
MEPSMHEIIHPSILYFGTPVVIVSTLNEDGSSNLSPISSAWWLGWNAVLGFGAHSKTPQNLQRTRQCVVNLPSVDQVGNVDRLALLTGSNPVPPHKIEKGYVYHRDKFAASGFTPLQSHLVAPPRVAECPIQLEAELTEIHPLATQESAGRLIALEVKILRVHIAPELRLEGESNHVDPEKWRPLIMSFCRFFGLGEEVHPSRLATIPESSYRPARVAAMLAASS